MVFRSIAGRIAGWFNRPCRGIVVFYGLCAEEMEWLRRSGVTLRIESAGYVCLAPGYHPDGRAIDVFHFGDKAADVDAEELISLARDGLKAREGADVPR